MIQQSRLHTTVAPLALLLAFLLVGPPISSAPLQSRDVQSAVLTWVRQVSGDARPDAVIERLEPYVVNGKTSAYIAHLSGGGFCLCGGDDLALPVYLYNPTGTYDPTVSTHQYILKDISDRVIRLQAELDAGLTAHQAAIAQRRALWSELSAGRSAAAKTSAAQLANPVSLALPLTSHWDQGSPYNAECPAGAHGCGPTVTGCVATAAAQVMRYWQWPTTGTGAASFYYPYRWFDSCGVGNKGIDTNQLKIPNSDFWRNRISYLQKWEPPLVLCGCWDGRTLRIAGTFSIDWNYADDLASLYNAMHRDSVLIYRNLDVTTYNWSLMADRHPATPEGDAEVAKLMIDIGTMAGLEYSQIGTYGGYDDGNPSTRDLLSAMRDNFYYDDDIRSDVGRAAGDLDSIVTDLQWFRPVLLAGGNATDGHAWVACGYNSATSPTTILMNYGWSGGGDGWYTLDTCLFPLDFSRLAFVAPNAGVKFVGNTVMGDGGPANPISTLNAALGTVPNGTTIILKAGTSQGVNGGVVTKPIKIKGTQVSILKE